MSGFQKAPLLKGHEIIRLASRRLALDSLPLEPDTVSVAMVPPLDAGKKSTRQARWERMVRILMSMPAWGETHEDEERWELVAFLQKLPSLIRDRLPGPARPPDGKPAEDGHDHRHGDMTAMAGSASTEDDRPHGGRPHDTATPRAGTTDGHHAQGQAEEQRCPMSRTTITRMDTPTEDSP
ncbi:c-type cytochrome [Halomonas aestuarii]|uniref:c-type cytochrome n=1 Tax=Halomonas aestuarii TaxID=1897729 RepID=UPI000F7A3819|nr:cytochrome c [Halomonas aestuarii]